MVATTRRRRLGGGGLPFVTATVLTFIAGLGWAGEPRPEPYFAPHGSPVVTPTPAAVGPSMPIADPSLGVGDDTAYSSYMAMGALPTTLAAGRTAGTFGVTPSGAASYVIPIWTPPGVATVDLKLSLNCRGWEKWESEDYRPYSPLSDEVNAMQGSVQYTGGAGAKGLNQGGSHESQRSDGRSGYGKDGAER